MSDISDRWYPRDTTEYVPTEVNPWCEHDKPFLMCGECLTAEHPKPNKETSDDGTRRMP